MSNSCFCLNSYNIYSQGFKTNKIIGYQNGLELADSHAIINENLVKFIEINRNGCSIPDLRFVRYLIKYLGLRIPIYITVFVLYSSFPANTASKIRFCCFHLSKNSELSSGILNLFFFFSFY